MSTTDGSPDWVGRTATRRVRISEEMLDDFVALSGDTSPIHVDGAAARARGFSGRVVHGMLLGSLVSAVLGTDLPGESGVLQDVRLSFRNPCHAGDRVDILVAASEFFESVQTLVLEIKITRDDGTILATGQARSGLRTGNG
jgi:3-hydroxybutyryl-CoA dehydratase